MLGLGLEVVSFQHCPDSSVIVACFRSPTPEWPRKRPRESEENGAASSADSPSGDNSEPPRPRPAPRAAEGALVAEAETVRAEAPGEERGVDPQAAPEPRRLRAGGLDSRGPAPGNAEHHVEPGNDEGGPGFTKTFTSVLEFLSFARAELARLVLPTPGGEERLQASDQQLALGE